MDTWRVLVYTAMKPITRGIADNADKDLRAFEINKVKQMAWAYLKDEPFSAMLTPEEITYLTSLVTLIKGDGASSFSSFDQWIPGQNANFTS